MNQNNNEQPDSTDLAQQRDDSTIDLLIIGAGFSGLCMGVKAKEAGYRMRILEKGLDVGGVWRENTYPGAACDVPWYLYSFSFFKETIFSRPYPQQAEILQYQQDVARHYALYNDIDFGEEVDTAQWDASGQCWRVQCRSGRHYTARTLVSAVGVLTRPAWPDIAGLESFKGDIFHSAQWRHDISLKGKRIGVVGSGASAVQFVPEVAREARELTVFQRSAPYILPRLDSPHSAFKLAMFRRFPALVQGYRQAWWHYGEWLTHTFKGKNIVSSFVKSLSRLVRFFAVRDPVLRKKLTPDYAPGCKRILFADSYYKAFKQRNVHLNTSGIDHFTETGLVDRLGTAHNLDAVILGTGFKATEFLAPMTVIGRDGQNLHASWQPIARAYLGMSVPGFPNFFMMYGPNTNLGSNSIIYMIECQANYIVQALDAIRSGKNLEVRESVFNRYNDEMQSRLAKLVWAEGCGTWYTTNEGLNPTNWPGMTREYRDRTATLKSDDFLPAS